MKGGEGELKGGDPYPLDNSFGGPYSLDIGGPDIGGPYSVAGWL